MIRNEASTETQNILTETQFSTESSLQVRECLLNPFDKSLCPNIFIPVGLEAQILDTKRGSCVISSLIVLQFVLGLDALQKMHL